MMHFFYVRSINLLRSKFEETCMTGRTIPDTDKLLLLVGNGDGPARSQLLDRHRSRLRRMVMVRIDSRLTSRVDPSDVVQDTLAEAHRRLDDYVATQPVPFYPWLRQLAQDRMVDLYRRHVRASRRAVGRENTAPDLSNESVSQLIHGITDSFPGPSETAHRHERAGLLRAALASLPDTDREILILRHLEQLTPREIAEVLGVSQAVVYSRHLRALGRLRKALDEERL
jgi:RNA polymerase sigma-70 factor (ECF subfamily)